MHKHYVIAGFVLFSLLLPPMSLAAEDIPLAGEHIARMEVEFTWTEKHTCQGPSPQIKLSKVPFPVIQFTVYLKDMTKPDYFHGGGIVQKRFKTIIKEGELCSYYGPCFTEGPPRNFVMRVYGLDIDGKIIAYGEKILPYPAE